MKRFFRWLLRPLVRWISTDEISVGFGRCESACIFRFEDTFGVVHYWPRTPEQVRELAWVMIGAADEVENAAEMGVQ